MEPNNNHAIDFISVDDYRTRLPFKTNVGGESEKEVFLAGNKKMLTHCQPVTFLASAPPPSADCHKTEIKENKTWIRSYKKSM
jgi:hypothetical protein